MRVAWCFPDRKQCGIAMYSRNYIKQLERYVDIIQIDTDTWHTNSNSICKDIATCDIVHIQYESSFFFSNGRDFYPQLLSAIKKPVIVSLHEVYRHAPDVYPRENITGNFLSLPLKKLLYDFKHPLQTNLCKHYAMELGASVILVHHRYQKNILIDSKIPPDKIIILPMPILQTAQQSRYDFTQSRPLILGSTGFINPDFDYELLISFLEQLPVDWKFIWVGGVRKEEHTVILSKLQKEIQLHHWENKFTVTGWVDDSQQTDLLKSIDIYTAFFKNRSSSASLARALGAQRLILALKGELTNDINECTDAKPLIMSDPDSKSLNTHLQRLISNPTVPNNQLNSVKSFVDQHQFPRMANVLHSVYQLMHHSSISQDNLPQGAAL